MIRRYLFPFGALFFLSCSAFSVEPIKELSVSQIHPTQPGIGFDEVLYKIASFQHKPKKLFDAFCENQGAGGVKKFDSNSEITASDSFSCLYPAGTYPEKIKSAVIAPDHHIYLTDGHHTVSVFRDIAGGKDFPFRVRITNDFSKLPDMPHFWQTLQQQNLTWLISPEGQAVSPQDLPKQVGMAFMVDDTYRSALYFLRNVAYQKPDNAPPFLEFYLGSWLRKRMPLTAADMASQQAYSAWLARAAAVMVQAPPDTHTTDDVHSPTLAQAGTLSTVDHDALDKLNGPNGKLTLLYTVKGK